MSNCFCVGKQAGCTCDGACRCACTCVTKDKTFESPEIYTTKDKPDHKKPPNCS